MQPELEQPYGDKAWIRLSGPRENYMIWRKYLPLITIECIERQVLGKH
jgi:hypothetical protein